MACARVRPEAGGARRAARASTSSTTRSPCRSRASGRPQVVTLFDVQHLDLPRVLLARRAALPALGLRRRRAPGRRSWSRASELLAARALVESARGRPGARRGDAPGHRPRAASLPSRATTTPPAGRTRPAARASSSTRRTCGRTRTTSGCVEALRAAWQTDDLALVLTGQTYGRLERLMERARRSGVAERVLHLGYLARRRVPALYRARARRWSSRASTRASARRRSRRWPAAARWPPPIAPRCARSAAMPRCCSIRTRPDAIAGAIDR